jgi:hypothetical protein
MKWTVTTKIHWNEPSLTTVQIAKSEALEEWSSASAASYP